MLVVIDSCMRLNYLRFLDITGLELPNDICSGLAPRVFVIPPHGITKFCCRVATISPMLKMTKNDKKGATQRW